MSENKYHIKIARDETRSMGRAERLWYKGTAKWFLLFGLIVLAGVGGALAFMSVKSDPVPKVSGARIVNPVVQNTTPHYYLKITKGSAKVSADGNTWTAAQNGTLLESGSSLQTQDESYVTLISNQNSVVRLAPNSKLTINDVSAPSAKIFQTNMKLEKGQAWTHLVVSQDEKVVFSLATNNFLVNASEGIFNLENIDTQRVASISGKLAVKEISVASSSDSILKDSVTHEYSLDAGKSVTYKDSGTSEAKVLDASSSLQNSYWWKWNKEQDADYDRSLKNKVSDAGPPLDLDSTQAVIALTDPYYEFSGRTSLDARIFVNNIEVANQQGSFSYKIAVPTDTQNAFSVNVMAVDHLGNKSVKTFSLSLTMSTEQTQTADTVTVNGVALNLTAQSVEGGVELIWNNIPRSNVFDGYHLVRSESNGALSYPKNEQFAEISDAKTSTYLDVNVSEAAKYFYRVCVKSQADRYDCSNVFTVTHKKPKSTTQTP